MNTLIIRYEGLSPTWRGDAVTGQKGTLWCSFSFDERWNEYDVRYMVVTKGNRPFDPIKLDKDNSAEVPEIALLERSFLKIGAVGLRNADGKLLRYNGRPCKILVDQGNLIQDPNMEPDDGKCENAYEQLLAAISAKLDANQGSDNAGRVLVVGEDGIVRPGEYSGGGGSGGNLPPGGKAGQILYKKSDKDFDVEWDDIRIPEEYGLVTYDQNRTITIS